MPYGLATAGDVLTAANVNLLPRGRVAYATTAVDQSGITTETAVTGLTVTFTALANRYYRITAHTVHFKDATVGTTRSIIRENSTNVDIALRGESAASTFQAIEHSVVRQPAAGSITYSLRAISDAGEVEVRNSLTNGFILVEDIGGV